jgi:Tol biopolymer transport system component
MKSLKQILVFITLISLTQCSNKSDVTINYPDIKPDSIALPYLPGIVCSDSLDFNAAFTPDGKSFFFARSVKGKYKIFVSRFDGKNWTKAISAPFSEQDYSEADPFITSDGTVYFISDRPKNALDTLADFDIWFVRALANGKWSDPENLHEINSDSTEYYVSLAMNGNIYFASNRVGSYGSHDIYVSKFVNGKYTTPENLGPNINSVGMEHDPFISKDEQFLIFTSVGRQDSYGEGDLYYSKIDSNKKWSTAKNMGARFNSPTYEYCSYLSSDSKYFFFSSDFDVKWIDAKYLPNSSD